MKFIYKIFDYDKELFLYLNGKHSEWLDPIMLLLSSATVWALVCLVIVCLMIYKGGRWRFSAPLALLLTIGVNSTLNNLVKFLVERPRPIHVEAWHGVIYAIEKYERSYSFYSGHSSISFALAVFALLYFRNKMFTCLAILWASAVAYSRIYLGKHYPIDVVTGILCGIMVGIFCYKLFELYQKKKLNPKIE